MEQLCQICGEKVYVKRCLGCGKRVCEDCVDENGYCKDQLCVIY